MGSLSSEEDDFTASPRIKRRGIGVYLNGRKTSIPKHPRSTLHIQFSSSYTRSQQSWTELSPPPTSMPIICVRSGRLPKRGMYCLLFDEKIVCAVHVGEIFLLKNRRTFGKSSPVSAVLQKNRRYRRRRGGGG